jgi:hypothetical protein
VVVAVVAVVANHDRVKESTLNFRERSVSSGECNTGGSEKRGGHFRNFE